MIIKEILMLILLLQFCNSETGAGGKNNDLCTGGVDVIERYHKISYDVYSKICISSNHTDETIKKHPGKYLEPISQSDIKVMMADVEIKRIDEYGLIIGLDLEVEWLDNRLKIWHKNEELLDQPFKLRKREFEEVEDLFWVPHFKYGRGFVLDDKELRKIELLCYRNSI